MKKPRIILLRGHGVTPWELRPWELLTDRFEIVCLVTGSNRFDSGAIGLESRRARALRDLFPSGRLGDLAVLGPGDRYLGLERHLEGADIVHSLELGIPWSGQPAALKRALGFQLILTVWETIPLLGTYRYSRGRRYRERTIPEVDLFLATTERARDCLVLEGAADDKIVVCPPGIDVKRFSTIERRPEAVVSVGRLVWEKGHQDVMRALAAIRKGVVNGEAPRLIIVGSGPDETKLRHYASELEVSDLVEIVAVPYEGMPDILARASSLVLASLAIPAWEEQFGMVLAEAMAARVPIVASASGAIPEVVGEDADLFEPGDWMGLARLLVAGPSRLASPERIARYSIQAAGERLADAYERALGT